MYILINTFDSGRTYLGRVLSRHRTLAAAQLTQDRHSRSVKARNGSAIVRTHILEAPSPWKGRKGDWLKESDTDANWVNHTHNNLWSTVGR